MLNATYGSSHRFFTALFHRRNHNDFTRKKNMDKCNGNSEGDS